MRKKHGILVMCDTYLPDKVSPARYNYRYLCQKIMEEAKVHEPWFGIEQEFFLFQSVGTGIEWPYGFPLGGYAAP